MKKEMGGCVTGSHKESKPGRTRTQREIGCDCSRICGWLPSIYTFRDLLATVFLYSSPYSAYGCQQQTACCFLPFATRDPVNPFLCHLENHEENDDWFNLDHLVLVSTTLLPRVGPFRKRSAVGGSIQD